MGLKVTLIPAAEGQPARAAVELDHLSAVMLQEMASKAAVHGPSARVLADVYDAAGVAVALLEPPKG